MNNVTKIPEGQKVFLCSDLHIGHANVIRFDKRPFSNIAEHDKALLKNWNEAVGHNDWVFFLGDWCFNQLWGNKFAEECFGRIFFIQGNHDHKALNDGRLSSRFEWIRNYHELEYQKTKICLFHYEIEEWNRCHRGSIHCFGHSHKEYEGNFKKFNVGINLIGYKPISIDDVMTKMEGQEIKKHH